MEGPGSVAELLSFVVRRLDEDIESGRSSVQPPALLRLDGAEVACAVGGVALHVKPLDGHPAQVLAGFIAPPEWFGVGVLVTGWQHDLTGQREKVRARITTIVCRDGSAVDAVRTDADGLRLTEGEAEGLVPDTLRRVLGMPTAPPAPGDLDEWMAKCWLQIVLKQSKRGKREPKLRWREVAALHPAIDTVGADPADLASVAPALATQMTWERFRQIHADDGDDLAAWMDEGMFARWSVQGYPPVTELLRRAQRRLTPDAFGRVEATLATWGLLDRASAA